MSLLSRHLEQIQLSSEAIATLPFPPPKIFTNALLSTSDITSLIRDTEPHERALFSVNNPPPPPTASTPYVDPKASSSKRRQTVFNVTQAGEVTAGSAPGSRAPRRNTAVAAVLGPELHNEVKRAEGKGEVDIEVLLQGAEKLNAVYEVRGTSERIRALRERWRAVGNSVNFYEQKVERQTRELEKINRGERWESGGEENDEEDGEDEGVDYGEVEVTEEDLKREEEEIRELEAKKRALEERVKGMERDLGGLLR